MTFLETIPRRMRAVLATLLATAATILLVPSADAATSLSIEASNERIAHGAAVTLSGVAAPTGATAEQLVVTSRTGADAWKHVETVTTPVDGSGAWSVVVKPARSTTYRVLTVDGSVVSDTITVRVRPRVKVRLVGAGRAFQPATIRVSVVPRTYDGPVRVRLDGAGSRMLSRGVKVRNGIGTTTLVPAGAGRFRIRAATASSEWDAATAASSFVVSARTLRIGSRGADVRGLQSRLSTLGFLSPRTGERYTFATGEMTLAFQKAYGLPRTYVWGQREWRKLASVRQGPRPRFARDRTTHIEVDKSRQIMMVAKGSKVLGIIAVSTGATGNTPVGSFKVYQRGGSYLYRFMAFIGNFGLHGYNPVPTYPASHGCVRQPNWAATFTWNHSKIGTKVHIYQ